MTVLVQPVRRVGSRDRFLRPCKLSWTGHVPKHYVITTVWETSAAQSYKGEIKSSQCTKSVHV